MTAATKSAPAESILATLAKPEPSRLNELPALFHEMLESIEHYSSQASKVIYRELETLSRFIADANAEIVAIRPKEICDLHLPAAADELDAVVGHTEQATNTIFAAVEAIEAVLPEMPAETSAKVTDAVTQIYEACSFQDITGQRIAKVVRAMQEVQSRVGSLLVAFADGQGTSAVSTPADGSSGPALPSKASSQADIDALMNGTAAAPANQDDIDAMFDAPKPAGATLHRLDGKVELHGPQLPKSAPNQADIDALFKSLG